MKSSSIVFFFISFASLLVKLNGVCPNGYYSTLTAGCSNYASYVKYCDPNGGAAELAACEAQADTVTDAAASSLA